MPQGSGKSVIAIAAAEKLIELRDIFQVLIICPTSIGWQWEERIKEFTDHDVKLTQAKDKPSREYGTNRSVYSVIPYSVFRKDYKEIRQAYDLRKTVIIADEAQEFSNFRSKTLKLIRQFKSDYRWALTGTAVSNKLEELYAIMEWVDPYFLPHWKKFDKYHIIRNPKTKQVIKYKNLDQVYKYLKSKRMVRKTLDELKGSLPELIQHKIYIEKDADVKKSEHNLLDALRNTRNTRTSSFDPQVSQALHKARHAVCNETKLNYATGLIKRITSESGTNRVVIFNFHKQPLYKLHASLLNHSIPSLLFTGDQEQDDKISAIKKFQSGEAKVLIASNAGSTGLDLPFANYVIHLDVPFSHGILDQRSKRIQRTSSQFSSVVVILLLVKNSIDEYYYGIVSNKSSLASAVLEGKASKVSMRPESLSGYLERVA